MGRQVGHLAAAGIAVAACGRVGFAPIQEVQNDAVLDAIVVGPTTQVSFSSGVARHPDVALTPAGLVVTWDDTRHETNEEIYYVALDGDLRAIGAEQRLTTNPERSNWPDVTSDPLGFSITWQNYQPAQIRFARFDTSAMLSANPIALNSTGLSFGASPNWNGSSFGVTWNSQTTEDIYFAQVGPDGTPISGEVRLTAATGASGDSELGWVGTHYGLIWRDDRDGTAEHYFIGIDASGAVTIPERRLTAGATVRTNDAMSVGERLAIAWGDERTGTGELRYMSVSAEGIVELETEIETPVPAHDPSLVWTGSELGITWADANLRDVYLSRIDAAGARIATDVRLTGGDAQADEPRIAWTGDRYIVCWQDARLGSLQIFCRAVWPS